MFDNVLIILPIFALVLAGWIARKAGALSANATREVNRLVVYLALPALLFDIMANARVADIWEPGFILALSIGCFAVFAAALVWRLAAGRGLADAAIDGLNASYANSAYLGFPVAMSLFGEAGRTAALIATIITVCVLFAIGIVLIEIGLQAKARTRDGIAVKTFIALAKNPLVIAPVLGGLFLGLGWHLPQPIDAFLKLLGAAASPCALITLGLFLAGPSGDTVAPRASTAGILVGLKLIAQPLVTWGAAVFLLKLPPATTHMAVVLAALPTGTGAFMLAEFYGREASLTARVVLVSTVLSVVTIALYLTVAGV